MKTCLLISLLRDFTLVKQFTLKDWELIIRQARSAGFLARLNYFFNKNDLTSYIPEQVLKHFISDWVYYKKLQQSVNWEIIQLKIALKKKGLPLNLMKGTAYVVLNLEAAKGRIFSDIDLLFSVQDIELAETALMNAGWMGTHHEAYDRNYYRQWMHEIPPLCHVQRQSVLDVHHNILPPTAKIKIDVEKIIDKVVQQGSEEMYTLSNEDLVLHSATHLFHEGDFIHGLRDISDLDLLLKEFSKNGGFWLSLSARAKELSLGRPLFYALRYTVILLNTAVPEPVRNSVQRYAPSPLLLKLMDFLFLTALMPGHASCDDKWTGLARWLLYVRSHWLRMPLYLLVPHLLRKSWLRLTGKSKH